MTKTTSGAGLARIAYEGNAYLFHADDDIAETAKDVAAGLFDFLRDLGDIGDDLPFVDRLAHQRSLKDLLDQLTALGADCYTGFRNTSMVGQGWPDKTPIALTIAYLTVVPTEKVLAEIMVPRKLA